MQFVVVFFRGGEIFGHSHSLTRDGFWVASEPYFYIESGSLAECSRECFVAASKSKSNVKTPAKPVVDTLGVLYAAARVKNWKQFIKGAKCIDLLFEGAEIVLIPQRNMGSRGDFEPISEQEFRCDRTESALETALGVAVARAI